MKGTEKQVKWAEDIKSAMYKEIEVMRSNRARFDAYPSEKPDNNLYPYTTACIDAVEAELNALWSQDALQDAAVVINNRTQLTPGTVKRSADHWMRANG